MTIESKTHRGDSKRKASEGEKIPAIEWFVGAIGLALVLASLGFLLHKALFVEASPPHVRVELVEIIPQAEGALVIASVRNLGGKSVAAVTLTGRVADETSEVTLDFVPAHSSRRAGLVFESIPKPQDVRFEIGGYEEP